MAKRQISYCTCGKVKSKHLPRCKKCQKIRDEKRITEATAIVSTGKCPRCGEDLKRNLALNGWWQCSQYGAVGFRKEASKPSCEFQTFTV